MSSYKGHSMPNGLMARKDITLDYVGIVYINQIKVILGKFNLCLTPYHLRF